MNWKITLKTDANTWSTIEIPAATSDAAIATAKRLLGNHPVTNIV